MLKKILCSESFMFSATFLLGGIIIFSIKSKLPIPTEYPSVRVTVTILYWFISLVASFIVTNLIIIVLYDYLKMKGRI